MLCLQILIAQVICTGKLARPTMISVQLDGLFSFYENQCTDGKEVSESIGANSGLAPSERQTTAKMYTLTQSPEMFPGHLVEAELVCMKCTVYMTKLNITDSNSPCKPCT